MTKDDSTPRIDIRSRADLRDWLMAHHATARTVWLVLYKKHHPDHLPWPDVVEELLCWGWIDSLPRALDADRTMLRASPRKDSSAWSGINKAHVARAIASGAMTAAGLAKVDAAKANGMWDFLEDVERLEVPDDLATAFDAHPPARAEWDSFPPSARRGILEWIKQAKRPQTRADRITQTATLAQKGQRANQWR
ncbi:uncharacterized protein YdeI (YjbR/CyaY-like superfamily) [Rubricella aquisinus]|uniref:Uncharacterized protein YdeI (YjbR/CyaY-like superfamily) n=1 Tax=Rubricella aquisinus TaxID=2028108 RepID=A0A840WQ26_9RHOB|nr:YdeI/OmpD-associated family protein [Rubricella aquisinus]MBB5516791.1 uncharacterized protein YdeI (YjbR/CyaY-like superfamily) [Rubricella aquisinus]